MSSTATATARCGACDTPSIKTRRSCPGCGMRPGRLHNNGLCATCQHPTAEEAHAMSQPSTEPAVVDAVDTGTVTRVTVSGVTDETTAIAMALDYVGRGNEYDSVEDQGGGSYEVVIPR